MRAAVLGRPVSHSLSPVLHRAAYEELASRDRDRWVRVDADRDPDEVHRDVLAAVEGVRA